MLDALLEDDDRCIVGRMVAALSALESGGTPGRDDVGGNEGAETVRCLSALGRKALGPGIVCTSSSSSSENLTRPIVRFLLIPVPLDDSSEYRLPASPLTGDEEPTVEERLSGSNIPNDATRDRFFRWPCKPANKFFIAAVAFG